MQILMNTGGIAVTNCFVIADEEAKTAVLFDAPNDTAGLLLDEVEKRGWNLIGLWLTHGHFDHIADHALVRKRFPDAKILIHALDEPKLQNPQSLLFRLPFTVEPGNADAYLEDGQTLQIGSLHARVIHTPGHAPGHVCFYFESENLLVGGDLIIMHAIGRTDFLDCDPVAMEASVRRIMKLPPQTRLLPGHGDPGTLGDERETNMYVREILGV